MIGRAATSALRPGTLASPRLSRLAFAAWLNGPVALMKRLTSGATLRRLVKTGVASSENSLSRVIVGRSSAQERRQLAELILERRAALGGGGRQIGGVLDEAGHVRALACAAGQARCRTARARSASTLSWLGEQVEDLVGGLQRRVGVADDAAEVLAAPGQRGAELVDDDRQPLAVGQPHDVVDEVDVDRPRGVGHGQQALALALALLDVLQRLGPAGRPRAAASACTRRTSRRSATAGGSCTPRRSGSRRSRRG